MAMLGVYTDPAYMLVRLLPWKLLLVRPRYPCWFGRSARGMNMNDLSELGKIYLGCSSGMEIRTGLSLRRGGRCCGNKV